MADSSDIISPQITAQHPGAVDAYIRHGWSVVPIGPNSKHPVGKDWNQRQNCLKSSADLPAYHGVGLAHAYSGTMALDIDNWDRAYLELIAIGVNLDELYDAPDAVVIHSGKPGHGKLLYTMPFGLVLPSKKLQETNPDGSRYNYLDFRCGTINGLTVQDVLPPSIHPETLKPYSWEGKGNWTRAPEIPMALLDYWRSLIVKDETRAIPSPDNIAASWDEVREALQYINPDCSRDEWVQIGMALHYAGTMAGRIDDAMCLWDEWSAISATKYPGRRMMDMQWRSMRTDKSHIVRLGTLFHYASLNGWVRPQPDVAHLFKAQDVPAIEEVMTSFDIPPPNMDMSLWPDALRVRAEEIAEQMGCDPLVPLFAGLGAVCGAVDARTRLELMPGFQVPPVLWLMTIGEPADKKTPGSKPMMRPLKSLEIEDRPSHARALLKWEGRQAHHDTQKKAFLQWSASPESMLGGEPPSVPELDIAPVPLKIVVNDVTSQKLVRLAAERPRGLLTHLDEMSAWVRKMSDRASGEDRSSWVVSYEGDSYLMDRVGAGSIVCDNLAISIYGNIQPEVYKRALPDLSMDGLIQRFIPAILRWQRTKKGEPAEDDRERYAQWENLLRLVYALPEQVYKLSPEAYKMYRGFQDWYEHQKVNERVMQSSSVFMTAFGKLEGTCGRLALVLHIIENPFSPTVSRDTMQRAIEIVRSYVLPALRYSLDGLGGGSPFLKWLVDWIACNAEDTQVTLSVIRNRAHKRFFENLTPYQTDFLIISTMMDLEDRQWVTRLDDGSQEHRHHAVWAINPRLITQFSAYRARRDSIKRERLFGRAKTVAEIEESREDDQNGQSSSDARVAVQSSGA